MDVKDTRLIVFRVFLGLLILWASPVEDSTWSLVRGAKDKCWGNHCGIGLNLLPKH